MSKKIILATIAVIILGGAAGYFYFWPKTMERDNDTATVPVEAPLMIGNNAIYVSDQLPSISATIDFATLEKPGFVVIHESVNGKPGAIIGKSPYLDAGENKYVIVPLSRISKDGEKMFAMIHLDDGNRMFEAANDLPAKAEYGEPIMMEFMVQRDASAPGEIKL